MDVFKSRSVCFHIGQKPFLADRLLPLLWLKSLRKIIPIWGTPLKLQNDWGPHFTGQLLPQFCTIWLVLQHFHDTDQPHSSGVVWFNDIIKTQLARFVEALQLPWPKALQLVLLNVRSTLFGTHELSPFAIITGCPVHLVPASSDPQVIKVRYSNIAEV